MPHIDDTIKFTQYGRTISGRVYQVEVKEVLNNGLSILEIIIIRNRVHESYTLLEDKIEVIAHAKHQQATVDSY